MPSGSETPATGTASSLTGRKHMGAGEFLTRAPKPYAFRIDTRHPKTHWRAHDPGDQIRPAHAGTALVIDGELYEVVEHRQVLHSAQVTGQPEQSQRASGEAQAHIYMLSAWDDRHPLRGLAMEYSVEAVRNEHRALKQAELDSKSGSLLDWFGVITALLPARDQQHLAKTYGFDAVFWTRWSALVWSILWFGAAITVLRGMPLGTGEIVALIVTVGFVFEQFFRRGKAIVGEPCGSLLGRVFRALVPKHLLDNTD